MLCTDKREKASKTEKKTVEEVVFIDGFIDVTHTYVLTGVQDSTDSV